MESSDVERMRLKKQQQKARRREKRAAKQRAAEEAVHISEELRRVRMCWPELSKRTLKTFRARGVFGPMNVLSNCDWEQLGRDIANCDKLEELDFGGGHVRDLGIRDLFTAMNDHKISSLFRGWTRSSSIKFINLSTHDFSVAGVRSMVSFLQNANNLKKLDVGGNNIQSEGFSMLLRALCDSPIEMLCCIGCGIESIGIDTGSIPRRLKNLRLNDNSINAAGCRELAKLLQGRDSTLEILTLADNNIQDEGTEILAAALQNNTSLMHLDVKHNNISIEGKVMMLKVVNNISSIKATLQTNFTLRSLRVGEVMEEIQGCINAAFRFTGNRQKIIHTQLSSMRREALCRLQGIEERSNAALYCKFDPLHLPEILALVGRTHGLSELHVALKSSLTMLLSTVDRVKCLEQEMAYYQAKVVNLQAEIAAIKRAEGNVVEVGNDPSNKRRRM